MTNASYYSQQHRPSLCGHRLGTQLLPVQPRRADGTQIRQQEFRAQGISERKIRHCFHYDIWYSYEFWVWFIKQASFSQAIQLSAGNQQKDIKKLKHTAYKHQKSYWVIFLRNKFNLTIDGCSWTKTRSAKHFIEGGRRLFDSVKCQTMMKPIQLISLSYQRQEKQTHRYLGSGTICPEARDYFAVGFNGSHIRPKSISEDSAVNKFIVI